MPGITAWLVKFGFDMFCCKRRSVMWVRGAVMVLAGFGCMLVGSSISLAQYPGSAGDLNNGGFSASSSASSGSSGVSSGSSGGVSSHGSNDSASDSSTTGSGSYAGGNGPDGHDGFGSSAVTALPPKKPLRKRSLIRQFRLEFAKTLTIETANNRPLRALSAVGYLDQFSTELEAGLDRQADLDSLRRDLSLVRDAIDDRLDETIASYGGDAQRRNFFSKTSVAGGSASSLRTEVQKLKLKHELLEFGEFSLQAMGYYAR